MSWRGIFRKAGIAIDGNTFTFSKNKDVVIRPTDSNTTGTLRGLNVAMNTTGAATANMVEALRASITSDVKTGVWANAIVGSIDYSDTGAAHGMAAAICAEMIPPDGSLTRGALYSLDCVFGCGTSSTWSSAGPVAFIRFENWGTAAHFSANAFLFHVVGETGAAGALLSENSRTLKVRIGTTTKYLYLSDTEDDLGAAVFDTMVLDPGRIATGSLAGVAATLGATYAYGSGMYLRYDVTDWTGKGNDFVGMYLRAEATTVTAAGKSVYGTQIYGSTQQTMTTGQLNGALIYAYKKGSAAATINKMYAVQAELTWDADCGTTTLTTEAAIILAKVTGGTLADYTKLHGQIFRFGDMNAGSRTYGSGILMEDDADTSGTCVLTTGINLSIGCTTGISCTGTFSKGIDFTDATLTQGWGNAFFACGTGSGASVDQHSVTATDFYIPIQVNMGSIGNPTNPSHVTAAMLRVEAKTNPQAKALINALALRVDLSENVFGAACINASMNISDDMTVGAEAGGESIQSGYFSITGAGAITATNKDVQVLEAAYRQTLGGSGVDHVAKFMCNAPDCSVTNLLKLKRQDGTVTFGINIEGAMTTGIYIEPSAMTNGIRIGAPGTAVGTALPTGQGYDATGAPVGIYFEDRTALVERGESFTVGSVVTQDSTGGAQTGWPYTAFFYNDIRADITTDSAQHWPTVMINTAIASGKTVDGFTSHGVSSLHLSCDINGTLASSNTMSNLSFAGNSTGTISGDWVCMHVRDTGTGDFKAFFKIDTNATGCYTESYTGNSAFAPNTKGSFTQTGQLRIIVAGNTVYIPYGTVA